METVHGFCYFRVPRHNFLHSGELMIAEDGMLAMQHFLQPLLEQIYFSLLTLCNFVIGNPAEGFQEVSSNICCRVCIFWR
jgi:hypothetical protein